MKSAKIDIFQNHIINWFGENGREFYWRKNNSPYIILISELLLKRTNSRLVENNIEYFLSKYGSFEDIYDSPLEELILYLKPMGLYNQRAVSMKKLSINLIEEYKGEIPAQKEDLLKLPGVGGYTAGAVRVFGFGLKDSMVDSNVARLLSRVFNLVSGKKDPRRNKDIIETSKKVTPLENYKEFWWGVLDFGALVCKARNQKCLICPLQNMCNYYKNNH